MSGGGARLSIREIARRINVPESTLRYYRNVFSRFIPTIGTGRSRRHPEDAVEVFRVISGLFAAGESRETIRSRLESASPDASVTSRWSEIKRPSDGQLGLGIELPTGTEIDQPGRLRAREVEQLIAAMVIRDRELAQMHRDLLQLVGKLIKVLEVRIEEGTKVTTPPAPAAASARPDSSDDSSRFHQDSPDIVRLREVLAQERETVERLRKAKLELEQRLSKLERAKGQDKPSRR